MPGLVISTSVRTGPSTPTVRESSQLFIVGLAERGPSGEPVLVESIEDFENIFGGYRSDSYLHPLVECFFEEGGTRAYVGRVVGDGATVGALTLSSSAAVNLMTLTANGAGAWSANVDAEVTHPSASTFKVNLYYNDDIVYTTGIVSNCTQAVGRINTSAIASQYVTATLVADTAKPAVLAKTPLGAGLADEGSVDTDSYIDALEIFNDALGTGVVISAEDYSDEMNAGLVAHANAYSRVAFLYGAANANVAAIKLIAGTVQAENNAEHAAVFYPWVTVPTSIAGVTRNIPPVGYAAGKRSEAHNQTGPHVPAAGLNSVARFVTGTVTDINKTVGDDLDENYVNAIRIIQNTVRIYGARSCSSDTDNFRYITQQDVVNSIVSDCYRSLEDLVFSPIDGRGTIFSRIEARLVVILAAMRDLGALYPAFDATGKLLDNGYTVKCDATINPASQLQTGLVKAKVGLRVSSVGDRIEIDIVKSNLTTSVV